MKKRMIFVLFILAIGVGFLLIKGTVSASGNTHYVYPLGDVKKDTKILQEAINNAVDGDTLFLKAGTFLLGKITNKDVTVYTAEGTFEHMADLILRFSTNYSNTFPPGHWHQHININKQLTIKGEVNADGELLTKIAVPPDLYWTFDTRTGLIFGFQGSIIINSPNVIIEELIIDNLVEPIWAYSPGFDIRNCIFNRCGFGIYLTPDANLTYANPSNPIKSYFRNNELIQCYSGPWVQGSEVVVSKNFFDVTGRICICLESWMHWWVPINWEHVENNIVEDNEIDMNYSGSAIWILAYGGLCRNNVVRNNLIRNCGLDGIWIYATGHDIHGSIENQIIGNTIKRTNWPIGMITVDGGTAKDNLVTDNKIIDCFNENSWPAVWLAAIPGSASYCTANSILGNDYTLSGYPGIDEDIGILGGCVVLYEGITDNFVFESGNFPPGTGGGINHVTDLGINNRVVGHPANMVEKPAGIGQRITEEMKNKIEKVEERHRLK